MMGAIQSSAAQSNRLAPILPEEVWNVLLSRRSQTGCFRRGQRPFSLHLSRIQTTRSTIELTPLPARTAQEQGLRPRTDSSRWMLGRTHCGPVSGTALTGVSQGSLSILRKIWAVEKARPPRASHYAHEHVAFTWGRRVQQYAGRDAFGQYRIQRIDER